LAGRVGCPLVAARHFLLLGGGGGPGELVAFRCGLGGALSSPFALCPWLLFPHPAPCLAR
jgi:hypothetical protein